MTGALLLDIVLFAVAAIVVALAGTKLAAIADRLAEVTGLGEAMVGAVLLGASTSLSGIVTSVTAAATGYPDLAISNALGGIAAQTAFLAIADITYHRANLEYAAASLSTLVQGTLLITLLSFPLIAMSAPSAINIFGIHTLSLMMVLGYIFGIRLSSQVRTSPMWKPQITPETQQGEEEDKSLNRKSLIKLWLKFAGLAITIAAAGYVLAQTGATIATQTGLSQTFVGALFTAVSTSLPELITSIAAVRQGALTLAVSGIIGGNSFDTLLVAFSDAAYRPGAIYRVLSERQIFIIALTIFMTGILLLGLLRREKYGIAKIGFESLLVLIAYLGGLIVLFWWQ